MTELSNYKISLESIEKMNKEFKDRMINNNIILPDMTKYMKKNHLNKINKLQKIIIDDVIYEYTERDCIDFNIFENEPEQLLYSKKMYGSEWIGNISLDFNQDIREEYVKSNIDNYLEKCNKYLNEYISSLIYDIIKDERNKYKYTLDKDGIKQIYNEFKEMGFSKKEINLI